MTTNHRAEAETMLDGKAWTVIPLHEAVDLLADALGRAARAEAAVLDAEARARNAETSRLESVSHAVADATDQLNKQIARLEAVAEAAKKARKTPHAEHDSNNCFGCDAWYEVVAALAALEAKE